MSVGSINISSRVSRLLVYISFVSVTRSTIPVGLPGNQTVLTKDKSTTDLTNYWRLFSQFDFFLLS